MPTLNYLTSDWLKCGLLCFGVPPVPKCSIDVCFVRRKSFVTVFSGCGPRRDANDLSQKGKIALEPWKVTQCTFKPLAPTATTYDSVNSTQTHFSNQRAIKKNWENDMIEVFSALGREYKKPTKCLIECMCEHNRAISHEMHLTRGRRAEYVVPVLSARFSSSLEGRCRADTLLASPGLRN